MRRSRKARRAPEAGLNKGLAIAYRPISELTLDPKNPRLHDRRQIRQIARSIGAFGFNVPILVDENGNVIAGHGRVLAALELGWNEVPTICLKHLSAAQARAFMVADNRLTETSVWDDRLLGETLKELSELQLDFSLEATGFTMGEIDLRIEGLGVTSAAIEDHADKMPEAGPPVTQLGDLWLLGRHCLLCGSALDAAAFPLLMGSEQAAMVFSDPPYNVPITGHASGLGAIRHEDFVMAVGEMDEEEFTAFLTRACKLMAVHSAPGSLHFICMDWRHLGELLAAGRVAYSALVNLCVWAKSNPGMGSFYRSQHELVLVFKHGRAPHRNNVELGRHGRNRSNLWQYPNISFFGHSGEEGNLLALHPTVKPVALVADAILDCTARGELVLDSFVGSGTTIIAAERTGRRCYGLELEPRYVDTAIRRWQTYTGDCALQEATGKSFEELLVEREGTDA